MGDDGQRVFAFVQSAGDLAGEGKIAAGVNAIGITVDYNFAALHDGVEVQKNASVFPSFWTDDRSGIYVFFVLGQRSFDAGQA